MRVVTRYLSADGIVIGMIVLAIVVICVTIYSTDDPNMRPFADIKKVVPNYPMTVEEYQKLDVPEATAPLHPTRPEIRNPEWNRIGVLRGLKHKSEVK